MSSIRVSVIAAACLLVLGGVAHADHDWLTGSTDDKLNTLGDLQPGAGTVMIEYSHRYTTMYYAAKGGNWKFAEYQLKEALEIQEVAETTRPKRAKGLKKFEETYLDPLGKAIQAKDFKKFETAFKAGIKGCNQCHDDEGFAFIKYELPKASLSPILNK